MEYEGERPGYVGHTITLGISRPFSERTAGSVTGGYFILVPEEGGENRGDFSGSLRFTHNTERGAFVLDGAAGYRRQFFQAEDLGLSLFGRAEGSIYDWLFQYQMSPMMATMFATLAFYIASAAYRAFRARSAEATLLLVTATLIMLWRIPMGEWFLNLFPGDIPYLLNTYIMSGINMAVQRGIIIGAALGAASMSLRIILGIERSYLGGGD